MRNTADDTRYALVRQPKPGNVTVIARCRLHVECVARESDIWYVNNRCGRD